MAESLAHRWGQIIGDLLEISVAAVLEPVAQNHGLYLDQKGPRAARGKRKLVEWQDDKGNKHRLDYVLERGGTTASIGDPAAFVEIAWRRYTKHSKNKAQEIEGALGPIGERYRRSHPFLGVIVAGEFTPSSIAQLKSRGFKIIYFPAKNVFDAFSTVGIDASFCEATPESEFKSKIAQWNALSAANIQRVKDELLTAEVGQVEEFTASLTLSLSRSIQSIRVLVLHGVSHTVRTVTEAIEIVDAVDDTKVNANEFEFAKFEIDINYSNGDIIRGIFHDAETAAEFLRTVT